MLGFWVTAPRDCTESVYNNTRVRRQFSERMGGNGVGIAGAGGITGVKRRLVCIHPGNITINGIVAGGDSHRGIVAGLRWAFYSRQSRAVGPLWESLG